MDKGSSGGRVACPMENVSTTFQSLDTVRALHQTVVSLRSALEEAKYEIQRLRKQISVETDVKVGAKHRESTSQIAPIISTTNVAQSPKSPKITKLSQRNENENNIERKTTTILEKPSGSITILQKSERIETIKENIEKEEIEIPEIREQTPTPDSTRQKKPSSTRSEQKSGRRPRFTIVPDISVTTHPKSGDKSKGMASKIDVKIKVMSNIKMDGSGSDTSQSAGVDEIKEVTEPSNVGHARGSDTFRMQTRSEDNLSVSRGPDSRYSMEQSSKENISIIDDDSDGDNSVFTDDKPIESDKPQREDKKPRGATKKLDKEEVDDIEVIFSSDENREPIQEDLVSISEYDPWQNAGESGTPILVKFASLPSDQESPQQEDKTKKLPISASHNEFYDTNSPNSFRPQKSMESTDSYENHRSTQSSSLEKDNSEDQKDELRPLNRDESFDYFDNGGSVCRKWTNYNVLVETDISKCGIIEEGPFEMYRRNTCPNPPAYSKPIIHREVNITTRHIPSRLNSRYSRRLQYGHGTNLTGQTITQSPRPIISDKGGPKRSSSAQTEISALPEHWKSESQLTGDRYHLGGQCTLPSKFVPTITGCHKHSIRISDRTQEARRVLLSDINFTSMVPELSRSADHLCQDENRSDAMSKQSSRYYKGNLLKTPDYALKGITPSVSMTSPGVSQWTVNENSFGTQTIQTGESWGGKRGDSFDSCRSYSTGSRYSGLDPHHRSRSVPSVRCAICKLAHGGIRTSESMHYTPRVTFQEPTCKIRGSLPDLRHDCVCSRRFGGRSIFTIHGDSSGSTESLLDEADTFVQKSMDNPIVTEDVTTKRSNLRRMSENDIQRDYIPSKQSLPFLPRTDKCLKPGHLAKVISKNGRVVVGRVKYVGPLIKTDGNNKLIDDIYVGVQLQSKCGDCDGTFEGRKFFDCEPLQGLFVPFKKVVMAWTA